MAATNKVIVESYVTGGVAAEIAYTSPEAGKGTRITAVTAVNIAGSTDNFTIYTRVDAGAATNADSLIREKSLAPNESDTPPEVINQFVEAGGTIQFQTNTAGAIALKVSGIEFT